MRIATRIWDSGWGAILLTTYTILVVHLLAPHQLLMKPVALLPTILVMFIADRYNFQLIHFFAGGELQRSTKQVEQITDGNDFYESASEELQSRVDDLDRRAYQNNISVLAGALIAVTVPVVGFYLRGVIGVIVGLCLAVLAAQLLSRQSVQQLNTLAQNVSKPYTAKYENQ
ncbi:hypothetical protein PM032_16200 [Halorubrum ezzemoulense]|uniref:hypothetical protein n=1 Tax=Halorubrum ezzemoulense TaxID=337243 RepID=UPI00232F72A3|nr:hypothetical protein [Halorubrum ezzemoulense]MDB2272539.1 hypothetical protein [Halorubrum ezzemoulense]